MVMNCFPFDDNLVELRLKIIFKRAKTFGIFQRMVLAWANNLVAKGEDTKGEDTPKYFPHAVRFELKIAVPLLLTEEKRKANLCSRLGISIEEAGGVFENWLQEGWCDGNFCHRLWFLMMKINYLRLTAHLKIKSTSPVKFLRAVGRWRSDGVATISIFEGKETGGRWFCRSKFKIILRFRNEKTILTGAVAQKITAALVTLLL